MLNYLFSLFSNDMSIDLGTANTLVYVKHQGIVLKESSVVAVNVHTNVVLAIGDKAKLMLGRTPSHIVAVRPLKNGVIANFDATQKMIQYFIRKVHNRARLAYPRVVIGIPSSITEVERRAVQESAERSGAREVYLIDEPMAAAIGANMPIGEPFGNMIVDIGGGTTEVAVLSLNGVVVARSISVAGDTIDDSIIQYFRKECNLSIGDMTAEKVKLEVGSVHPDRNKKKHLHVQGRDQLSGLPKTIMVTSDDMYDTILRPINVIIETIKETLEATPAELAGDLISRGIVLAGGGALLDGLPELITQEIALPVLIAPDPLLCVALGAGKFLDHMSSFDISAEVYLSSSRYSN